MWSLLGQWWQCPSFIPYPRDQTSIWEASPIFETQKVRISVSLWGVCVCMCSTKNHPDRVNANKVVRSPCHPKNPFNNSEKIYLAMGCYKHKVWWGELPHGESNAVYGHWWQTDKCLSTFSGKISHLFVNACGVNTLDHFEIPTWYHWDWGEDIQRHTVMLSSQPWWQGSLKSLAHSKE